MKKFVSILVALLVCCSMILPVMAAENTFVPSITYKGGLPLVGADTNMKDKDGNPIGSKIIDCLVVTSISEAKNKSTDISQEDRDLLLDLYEKLSDGSMKLPVEGDYVIKEMVDLSFKYDGCRKDEEHNSKDECLRQPGVTLTLTFDLQVKKNADVVVLVYVDGEWQPIESVKNNGDGTVTCVFEDICPVLFLVDAKALEDVPKTGDQMGSDLMLWVGIMGACLVGIVAVSVAMGKKRK